MVASGFDYQEPHDIIDIDDADDEQLVIQEQRLSTQAFELQLLNQLLQSARLLFLLPRLRLIEY